MSKHLYTMSYILIYIMSVIKIKNKFKNIITEINKIGGNIYLVGGSVRDSFLYIDNNDIDFCITGITPESFMELFPEAEITGDNFPVFRLQNAEFAFARKEKKTGIGHNGFEMFTDISLTIKDDLVRRDLTINSMAINMKNMELIDLFDGINDIKNKVVIRHINSDAFKEDALRVYRVARFAATLNFNVSEETLKLMSVMKDSLQELSPERVFEEMRKALKSKNPRTFFDVLKHINILSVHFSEIADMNDEVYEHSMETLNESVKFTNNVNIRYAILLHDIGKNVNYYKHDREGIALLKTFSRRLKVPMKMQKMAELFCLYHMKSLRYNEMRISKKIRFLMAIKENIDELIIMVKVDCIVVNKPLDFNIDILIEDSKIFKEVTGNDIIIKYPTLKGKAFGEMLFQERIKFMNKEMK